MNNVMNLVKLSSLLAGLLFSINLLATPIGNVWPAPGGTSFGATGHPIIPGGATWTYSGFDTNAWSNLYFGNVALGFATDGNVDDACSFGGSCGRIETLTTSSIVGNTVRMFGTSMHWSNPFNGVSRIGVSTEFRFVFTDLLGGAVNAVTDASLGVLNANGFMVDMTNAILTTGGFRVHMDAFINGQVAQTYFNNNTPAQSDGHLRTSVSNGLWYDPPASVPEPSTLALLGLGLVGLGFNRHKRR